MTFSLPSSLSRLIPRNLRPRVNAFTLLAAVASAALVVRTVNIATYAVGQDTSTPPGITRSADAKEEKDTHAAPATLSEEDAPPLTQADINRSVKDSAAPEAEHASTEQSPAPAQQAAPEKPVPAIPPPLEQSREFSPAEIDALQSLSKRRDELDQRERNINESAALLKAAEKEVDRKLAELATLKEEIEKLLGQQEQMEDARITSLVKIYEAMKPKEAATIFNTLDPDVLLSVVGRMNERRLSPILASMDPEKARMVTIRLAEQRQLPSAETTELPATLSPAPPALPHTPETMQPDNTQTP